MDHILSSAAERCPVLSRTGATGRDKLMPHARIVQFSRGQTVFTQDKPADRCFVVLSGWVKLYTVRRSGEEAVIRVQKQGETLGFQEGMRAERYRHHASAVTPSNVLILPSNVLRETLDSEPDFGKALLNHVFDVNTELHDQIEALKCRKSVERLASFLFNHARTRAGKTMVRLPFDKTTLAAYLGMQPESLSRALAQLSKHGVRVEREEIEIIDIGALERLTPGNWRRDE